MFGTVGKSKSVASIIAAAALASALMVPAAYAASAGNSFEIPPLGNSQAYYSTEPTQVAPAPRIRHRQPSVVQRSTTNSNCQGGYAWSDSMAGNGMSIPAPCHS